MKANKYQIYGSLLIIYTMLFSFIIPDTISAKPVPTNSVVEQNTDNSNDEEISGSNSVYFEENQGQFDKRAKYFARGTNAYSLFLAATQAVYVLRKSSEFRVQSLELEGKERNPNDKTNNLNSQAVAVYMSLVGADENAIANGLQETSHKTNYFKGQESNWRTDIPNFRKVRMENVYQGIDTVWNGDKEGSARYEFTLDSGASLEHIEWKIEGAKSISLDEKGSLLIKTEFGIIKQPKPLIQTNNNGFLEKSGSKFIIKGNNTVGLAKGELETEKVGSHDQIGVLVCLTTLCNSTYLGGAGFDSISTIDANENGEIYVGGSTQSTNFPTTSGVFIPTFQGQTDGFITKFNGAGNSLVYSTYIGSDLSDQIFDIALDNSTGEVFITGATEDSNGLSGFPTTAGAFDTSFNGEIDAFITVLNANGNALNYSSFLGSDYYDYASDLSIDGTGNVYIVGSTETGDFIVNPFPTTQGAFNTNHSGKLDNFVIKMNVNTSTLVYSTLIGGSEFENSNSIAVDSNGNAYITGNTDSSSLFTGYPTTPGSFQTSHNGGRDAFVTKLNASGTALIYSTLLGGSSEDSGIGIAIDSSGNAIVVGNNLNSTISFPTTIGSFDITYNGGSRDMFVTKLDSNGANLIFSSYLGGNDTDFASSVKLDDMGNIIVCGLTESTNYPTTPDAFGNQWKGSLDSILTKINPSGTEITYSTYISGAASDTINDIYVSDSQLIYLGGKTDHNQSEPFPTTSGSYDTTHNGSTDGFVVRFLIPGAPNTNSAPFDFDGDSKSDISIFRPNVGEWWYLRSSDGANRAFQFGTSNDVIVPGDYTGDGKTDLAFFRPSTSEWFVLRSEDSSFFSFPFGAAGDIPAPGDYDGDGQTDAAVFRPSNTTWYINNSGGGTTITTFGLNGDVPAVADYDGDGKDDIAIYRPSNSQWWMLQSSAGVKALQFGQAGDKTVQGDYTGDGKADVAFWRPSNGFWFIIRSEDSSFYSFPFGASTDIPSPGDYDGDGKYDAAVFRPGNTTWFINGSTSGTQITTFGLNGDKPVPNAYVYQ